MHCPLCTTAVKSNYAIKRSWKSKAKDLIQRGYCYLWWKSKIEDILNAIKNNFIQKEWKFLKKNGISLDIFQATFIENIGVYVLFC